MSNVIEFLKGKKTYLCAAGIFIVAGCEALGWITKDLSDTLKGILGACAVASIRSAVGAKK